MHASGINFVPRDAGRGHASDFDELGVNRVAQHFERAHTRESSAVDSDVGQSLHRETLGEGDVGQYLLTNSRAPGELGELSGVDSDRQSELQDSAVRHLLLMGQGALEVLEKLGAAAELEDGLGDARRRNRALVIAQRHVFHDDAQLPGAVTPLQGPQRGVALCAKWAL